MEPVDVDSLQDAASSEEDAARRSGRSDRDPEARLQHARDVAWRSLNRRDRTVEEIRVLLADKRVEPDVTATVVAELIASGYLDDARYAQRFAEDRRRLDSWGRERIERRLAVLGVARAHISAAVSAQDRDAELDSAVALLRRRLGVPAVDDRERSRALGLLVRRGYEAELAYEAIRRHAEQGD